MRKKTLFTAAGALALAVILAGAAPASAEERQTTLAATVPSSYTLTIPKSQTIEYGRDLTEIGALSVKGNIRTDENLRVSVEKSAFRNEEKNHSFSFRLLSGSALFLERSWSGTELETEQTVPLSVSIEDSAWDEAQAGNYTATLIFTAEIRRE